MKQQIIWNSISIETFNIETFITIRKIQIQTFDQ